MKITYRPSKKVQRIGKGNGRTMRTRAERDPTLRIRGLWNAPALPSMIQADCSLIDVMITRNAHETVCLSYAEASDLFARQSLRGCLALDESEPTPAELWRTLQRSLKSS